MIEESGLLIAEQMGFNLGRAVESAFAAEMYGPGPAGARRLRDARWYARRELANRTTPHGPGAALGAHLDPQAVDRWKDEQEPRHWLTVVVAFLWRADQTAWQPSEFRRAIETLDSVIAAWEAEPE